VSSPSLSGRLSLTRPDLSVEVVVSVLLPASGMFLAELLLNAGFLADAIVGYIFTLLVCTIAPVYLREAAPVFLGFALLPVFRLVNLTMPVFAELTIYWLLAVYLPFLPATVLVFSRSSSIQLRRDWRRTLALTPIALAGALGLATVAHRLDARALLVPDVAMPSLAVLTAIVVFAAVVEELLFRGVLQSTLVTHLGPWLGIILAAGVFATVSGVTAPSAVGLTFAAGLAYGATYYWARSLFVPFVFHGLVNTLVFVIYPVYGVPAVLVP